jgi:hypothetical protein
MFQSDMPMTPPTRALTTPPALPGSGDGLFRYNHFQVAYATNDIDRACGLFTERFGIKAFRRLEGQLHAGGDFRIELGWAGGVMYELCTASGAGQEVFMAGLPTDRFVIRHHHLGYYVPTEDAWDALQGEIARSGCKVILSTDTPGFLRVRLIEVPELGHCLEYFLLEEGGVEFLNAVPNN